MTIEATSRPASFERTPHILLADDDDDFSELLRDALGDRGYRVSRVSDGIALKRRLTTERDADKIDIVLTDVCMPRLNGLEALRSVPRTMLPPVVVMTAFGSSQTHETAYHIGVAAAVDKPFEINDLCVLVDCLLESPADQKHRPVPPSVRSIDELCCGRTAPNR
jgi:two-component system, OmpR family, phosphate regulon response regulator OmpR